MDEARHVEVYKRLLHEKFDLTYPITPPLKSLLEGILRDSRWDMTYLGMQVLIEGLALAAFAGIRDMAKNQLAAAVNAYVMQDEARHVAFGRLALREYYPHLSEKERAEREEFVVDACYTMRDRFNSRDVYERLGLPIKECIEWEENSPGMKEFRAALFTRIVPAIKDIGLWGRVSERLTATWEFSRLPMLIWKSWRRATRRSRTSSIGRAAHRKSKERESRRSGSFFGRLAGQPFGSSVVRPPRLTNKLLTGTYRTAYGRNLRGGVTISRANVEHLMLRVLNQVIGIAN
jgi:hypothetical protein